MQSSVWDPSVWDPAQGSDPAPSAKGMEWSLCPGQGLGRGDSSTAHCSRGGEEKNQLFPGGPVARWNTRPVHRGREQATAGLALWSKQAQVPCCTPITSYRVPCLVPWPLVWRSGSLAITGLSCGPGCCSCLSCDSLSGSPRAPGSWPGNLGTSSTGLGPRGKQDAAWRVTFVHLGPREQESCQL